VFVLLETYLQSVSFIGDRFNTVIGVVFLVIVLLSPGGLLGLWESGRRRLVLRKPQPA